MEFKEPKPASKVEEFILSDLVEIFVFSIAISAEALHSLCDVPLLNSMARKPRNIPAVNLGSWNDETILIKDTVQAAMAKLIINFGKPIGS